MMSFGVYRTSSEISGGLEILKQLLMVFDICSATSLITRKYKVPYTCLTEKRVLRERFKLLFSEGHFILRLMKNLDYLG